MLITRSSWLMLIYRFDFAERIFIYFLETRYSQPYHWYYDFVLLD